VSSSRIRYGQYGPTSPGGHPRLRPTTAAEYRRSGPSLLCQPSAHPPFAATCQVLIPRPRKRRRRTLPVGHPGCAMRTVDPAAFSGPRPGMPTDSMGWPSCFSSVRILTLPTARPRGGLATRHNPSRCDVRRGAWSYANRPRANTRSTKASGTVDACHASGEGDRPSIATSPTHRGGSSQPDPPVGHCR
jgi:hypothetical protein